MGDSDSTVQQRDKKRAAKPAAGNEPRANKSTRHGGKAAKVAEIGGPSGPEPTRYGDWEVKGRCIDF